MPLTPIEFNVNVRPNREIITPLSFGDITYEFPTETTTDKISEIVVLSAPLPASRYAALFGRPSDVSLQQRRSMDGVGGVPGAPDKPDTDSTSAYTVPAVSLLKNNTSNVFADSRVDFLQTETDSIYSELLNSASSLYYPQVDFYPRYNQWFASASWPVPFTGTLYPQFYDVIISYAERQTRTIYYRYGRAILNSVDAEGTAAFSAGPTSAIVINQASITELLTTTGTGCFGQQFTEYRLEGAFNFTVSQPGVYTIQATYYVAPNAQVTTMQTYTVSTSRALATAGQVTVNHTWANRAPSVTQLQISSVFCASGNHPSIIGSPVRLNIASDKLRSEDFWFLIT